jgi:hypothetical protein
VHENLRNRTMKVFSHAARIDIGKTFFFSESKEASTMASMSNFVLGGM